MKKDADMGDSLKEILFPHDGVRKTQDELIDSVKNAIENKKNLVVHAPTGLGKTAATIAPALSYAIKNDLTIIFLTSRHTQHKIVLDTVKNIKTKHDAEVMAVSLIGKKWMCAQQGVDLLRSGEFHEFCNSLLDSKKCEYHTGTYKGKNLQPAAAKLIDDLKKNGANDSSSVVEQATLCKCCPYEIASQLASKANVIVTDYYYVFNPDIRKIFLNKTGKKLENSILIIDEGHNLPSRIRDLMSVSLSSYVLRSAMKEAKKFGYPEIVEFISQIQEVLLELSSELKMNQQSLVTKNEFMGNVVNRIKSTDSSKEYHELIADFEFAAEAIRQNQKRSFIGSIAMFLELWPKDDRGFARIVSMKQGKREPMILLYYRCLDPSLFTNEVLNSTHSTIMMSGTLDPTEMYSDILGFSKDTIQKSFESPFPEENRLNLIIPKTTTKYDMRSEQQYRDIAQVLNEVCDRVPGNCAVFLPSYSLLESVNKYFQFESKKNVLKELPGMTKQEKHELLENFKKCKKNTVLLGAATGSFGEGIDIEDNILKAVIVVGLPLGMPDLETKELISYYDDKFGKGQDYGYFLPAFIKTLQNAGRCIRSEKDRGIIVFLDQRFTWSNYFRFFPADWKLKISLDYKEVIADFFDK